MGERLVRRYSLRAPKASEGSYRTDHADICELLTTHANTLGEALSEEFLSHSGTREFEQLFGKYEVMIAQRAGRHPGIRKAALAATLMHCAVALEGKYGSFGGNGVLRANQQRQLSQAFLLLPDDLRMQVYNAFEGTAENHSWKRYCRGALCEARVVYAAHALGMEIRLTDSNADCRFKVDVLLPRAHGRWLALQVKRYGAEGEVYSALIEDPHSPVWNGQSALVREVYDGVKRMNRRMRVDFIPAIILVGLDDATCLLKDPAVVSALQSLLRSAHELDHAS